MTTRITRRTKRTGVALALVGLVTAGLAVIAGPAAAGEAPSVPVAAFAAPKCEGETTLDPTKANPEDSNGFTDLTMVSGARLTSYNKGNVVPLYDTRGRAHGSYPPLCATYFDAETGGPKSVWMFCTDVRNHTCGDVGPGGTLNYNSTDVGEMEDKAGNSRLSSDQETVIAWLLTNGQTVTHDRLSPQANLATTANRDSLQYLIWCVSDNATLTSAEPGFCEENLSQADQAEILTKVPATAEVDLNLDSSTKNVVVGEPRTITLRTNVYNQPISLKATGTAAGTLKVCDGSATLNGSTLTVSGTDPAASTTVELCLTPTKSGSYGMTASATPTQTQHIQWAQAASDCQVYARFAKNAAVTVSDAVNFDIRPKPAVSGEAVAAPTLVTKASAQVATPGAKLFDTVTLTDFIEGKGAKGTATLYGPLSSVTSKSCTPANRFATVSFSPRNGTVRTPSVKVKRAGYYTWVATTSADSSNKAAGHRCGLAAETTLVKKKGYVLTTVDTGFSGPAGVLSRSGAAPTLSMPAANVKASVTTAGINRGKLAVPSNVRTLGYVGKSAAIDDKIGTTIIAGHVSDRRDRPGAMWSLKKARKGQIITYTVGGKKHRFRVTKVQKFSRAAALPKSIASTTGKHRLVLITCTDRVEKDGRFHYTKNLVVTAVPVS